MHNGSSSFQTILKPTQQLREDQIKMKPNLVKGKRAPLPMSRIVISDIIYPVQTRKGLKWGKSNRPS